MKKILATASTFLLLTLAAYSQTAKDWYIIGGNIGDFGLDFQEDNTAFNMSITPRAAWFIKDDLAVGASATIGLNTSSGFTAVSYGIGPVVRYYLPNKGLAGVKKTRWFLDGNVGFNGRNTKVSGSPAVNTNGLGIGFGPGLAYFLNQNIALEILPKYNLTVGFGNSTTNNSLNLAIGFQIYLPKAKLQSMQDDIK